MEQSVIVVRADDWRKRCLSENETKMNSKTHVVHDVGPAFERDGLEDDQERVQQVVERYDAPGRRHCDAECVEGEQQPSRESNAKNDYRPGALNLGKPRSEADRVAQKWPSRGGQLELCLDNDFWRIANTKQLKATQSQGTTTYPCFAHICSLDRSPQSRMSGL